MSWASERWLCKDCKKMWDEIVRRSERDEPLDCDCGSIAFRIPFANITKASFVDGNGRFDKIRARRNLEKDISAGIDSKDLRSAAEAKIELTKKKLSDEV